MTRFCPQHQLLTPVWTVRSWQRSTSLWMIPMKLATQRPHLPKRSGKLVYR